MIVVVYFLKGSEIQLLVLYAIYSVTNYVFLMGPEARIQPLAQDDLRRLKVQQFYCFRLVK